MKLTQEVIDVLSTRKPIFGLEKSSILIGKQFKIKELNITDVWDKERINLECKKNEKLTFLLNEPFVIKGSLTVRFEDKSEKTVYLNTDLMCALLQSRSITAFNNEDIIQFAFNDGLTLITKEKTTFCAHDPTSWQK